MVWNRLMNHLEIKTKKRRLNLKSKLYSTNFWMTFFCSLQNRTSFSNWYLELLNISMNLEIDIGISLRIKSVRIRSFSGPYFPAFGLNTEICFVNLRIQSEIMLYASFVCGHYLFSIRGLSKFAFFPYYFGKLVFRVFAYMFSVFSVFWIRCQINLLTTIDHWWPKVVKDL